MTGGVDWCVLPDANVVARMAADLVLARASEAIAARGRFSLVLAGGRTPLVAYRMLRDASIDAAHWHIFCGDERCLPPTDPQRNSDAAQRAWLSASSIPEQQIHWMAAEQGSEPAASLYAEEIAAWQPFDLVLLGMGEDGHIASLFPGHEHPAEPLVVPVHEAPKAPKDRLSLNYGAICAARHRLLLATGEGKGAALAAWRRGEDLPVARVAACGRMTVLLDEAAASRA